MKYKGFTLIELLVVISVIALLLAILLPSLNKAREKARQVVCSSNLKQAALSTVLYAEDNSNYIPTNGNAEYDICRGEDPRIIPGSSWPWVGAGALYYSGHLPNPEVYYCPSEKINKYNTILYESPPNPYEIKNVYPSISKRPDYRIVMAYQYRLSAWCWGSNEPSSVLRNKQKQKLYALGKKGIIGDRAGYSWTIHFGARNYSYGDTHVERIKDEDMVTGMNINSGRWWMNYVDIDTRS